MECVAAHRESCLRSPDKATHHAAQLRFCGAVALLPARRSRHRDAAGHISHVARVDGLQASGADDEQGAQDNEAEGAGGGGGVCGVLDDARVGMLDSEGGVAGPEACPNGEASGARQASDDGKVDHELEGEGGVST
ncbi:hypothetical protein BD310DRAFT_933502 [Dichomitus squalens]|uniref:Uncharacterized protein n=1 Tax=Dichomitus squalens TaxID=114155 RepID=A0A4Q9PMV4_9APHY|nr:hypothetical protein BD310DRAFT_933502 [Dichomitus squalens]